MKRKKIGFVFEGLSLYPIKKVIMEKIRSYIKN